MIKRQGKEKKGPRGMVKRSLGKGSAGPAKPPPSIGDVVWYADKKGAWRTGRLIRVIDRGQFWGKLEVKDSASGSLVKAVAEEVRSL